MRKLFFALSALAALSLLAPSSGFAQANNQIGLYLVQDDYTTVSYTGGFAVNTLYAVIHYPYLEESVYGLEGPVSQIAGFELQLDLPPTETLYTFNPVVPGLSPTSPPEYVWGYGAPIDVVDNHCYLGSFLIATTGGENVGYRLTPVNLPSLAGEMAFAAALGGDVQELQPLYPSSSSHELPVFVINGVPTDVENETWGGLKSLYR